MLETSPTLGNPSITVAPRRSILRSSYIWMPSMGGVRSRPAYLKGFHIALARDTTGSRFEAVARRDLGPRALEHDAHGAVFLLRKLDGPLHVRLLPGALEDVREVELLEDRGGPLRALGLELDAQRLHGLPLLPEDVHDVDRGATSRSEDDALERGRPLADLALRGIVEQGLRAGVAGREELRWRDHLDYGLPRRHGALHSPPAQRTL